MTSQANDKMFELLENAYEKGLKGKVDSFDLWLANLGIDPKLFGEKAIGRLLMENVPRTVDRETELSAIVEFVGFYERERKQPSPRLFHLPIIGVPGVGKTQLLRVLLAFLQKKATLLTMMIDATKFAMVEEQQDETQAFLSILEDLKSKQCEVLLIDSCDKDRNIDDALKSISKTFKRGVLVTAWTPYHWDFVRENVEEFLPASKELRIEPFGPDQTRRFVSDVFDMVSQDHYVITDELSLALHNFSGGVASNVISLVVRSFQEAFQSKKKDLDIASIKVAANFLGLEGIGEKISQLADHQLLILKHLLLESDPRGTRPSVLVDILGKDKATISYHLSELSKLRLLENERIGRWAFYRVRREVAPLVGLRLAQEVDFFA